MKHRKLRIAWSVAWGVVAVLLCVLWARSYWWEEGFDFIRGKHFNSIFAARGGITIDKITPPPNSLQSHWSRRVGSDWEFGYRDASGKPLSSTMGFRRMGFINGSILTVPHWSLVLATIAVAGIPWFHWSKRFSLRTLFIATTLVAVVLGIIVWMSRAG